MVKSMLTYQCLTTYVHKQLVKYRYTTPIRPQYCPYDPAAVQYGRKLQEVPVKLESKLLEKEGKLYVQQVVGTFYITSGQLS